MSLSASQRIELYERLKRSSLGEEGANVVMSALPNVDWNVLATRDDLALLRGDLRVEMSELRADLRVEIVQLENRLQRSLVTWMLATQGVTLGVMTLLITVFR